MLTWPQAECLVTFEGPGTHFFIGDSEHKRQEPETEIEENLGFPNSFQIS